MLSSTFSCNHMNRNHDLKLKGLKAQLKKWPFPIHHGTLKSINWISASTVYNFKNELF